MPSLCGSAEATREWFRAFTAHSFLACRPLRPRGVRHRYPELRCRHWPSPNDHRLGTPDTPAIRSARAVDFVASSGSLPLQPARLLAPQYGSDWNVQPSGTFTSRLSTDRFPSPLLDITTTATGLLCWRDSHPLEWQLASLHGHSLPMRLLPRLARCAEYPESRHEAPAQYLTRMGQEGPTIAHEISEPFRRRTCVKPATEHYIAA
jgi:hypothetical protein